MVNTYERPRSAMRMASRWCRWRRGAAARVVRVLLVPEVLLAHRVQQTLVTQRGDRSTAAEGGVQRKFGVGPAGLAFSLVGKVTLDVRVSYGYEGTGERLVLRDEVMVDTENVHGSVGPLITCLYLIACRVLDTDPHQKRTTQLIHLTSPPPPLVGYSLSSSPFVGDLVGHCVVHCLRWSPQTSPRRDVHPCPMKSISRSSPCRYALSPTPRSPGRGRSGRSTRTSVWSGCAAPPGG